MNHQSYEYWTDWAIMAEVNRRPSETEGDLKWAALLYAHFCRRRSFSTRQRQILEEILLRSDDAQNQRDISDYSNCSEKHDEYDDDDGEEPCLNCDGTGSA